MGKPSRSPALDAGVSDHAPITWSLDLRGERAIPSSRERDDLLRLVVAEMELTALPADVGRLTGLTTFDAAHNRLRTVPAELGLLRALEILYLGDNELTAVPTGVRALRTLCYLGLDGNRLTSLPDWIGRSRRPSSSYACNTTRSPCSPR